MVHKTCGTRVKQQYICPKDDEIIFREDIVKGYEFAKGQYVLFSPDELKAVEQPKTDSIEITEFVPADQVEQLYFDLAYYLGPDKGGARAYRLLSAALAQTYRVAIAKHATRGKQHLVMVRPFEGGLLMEKLRYTNEVRSFEDVPLEKGEVDDSELDLAVISWIKPRPTHSRPPTTRTTCTSACSNSSNRRSTAKTSSRLPKRSLILRSST
jgi:DNA end-binding protein Ku